MGDARFGVIPLEVFVGPHRGTATTAEAKFMSMF